ncbi:hypothetical protein GOP47_0006840 [Adiantum capillus-veneris]|nr:hypothetical protein GOP47_0006840 [Adiantum capillus-veneris]
MAQALRSPSFTCLGKLYFHTAAACWSPRKRPGTRNPLPEEEIKKRVETIVLRTRKKHKPKDDIDWHFREVGNYHVKDEEIQKLYKEYLRLYHPEQAGDEVPASKKEENGETRKGSDHDNKR